MRHEDTNKVRDADKTSLPAGVDTAARGGMAKDDICLLVGVVT